MSTQTAYSLDFQRFLHVVETSLIQAAADARELAQRTGTPLVVRDKEKKRPPKQDINNPDTL